MNSGYLKQTRSHSFSFLACVPLLVLYEVLIRISQPESDQIIRISVDAWFKTVFTAFGLDALSATFYVAALAGCILLWRDRHRLRSFRIRYFFGLLLESLFYAIALALLISIFLHALLMIQGGSLQELSSLQLIALSLGAGLYEELFFRVILVSVLIYIFSGFFRKKWMASSVSVILAAACFSAVHYVGEFGDPFSYGSFLFRFLFGLSLNLIYVSRGFAMAAWTHAIYDLLVISLR